MNLYLRLVWMLLGAWRKTKLTPFETGILKSIVLPNDLDANMHMNNGRYLTIMDLGRIEWLIRVGLLPVLRKNKWAPVVGSQKIAFLKPLRPFQQFELHTRLLGWDEKWFYFHQTFHAKGELCANATIKGLFLSQKGRVTPMELARGLGDNRSRPR